jgi:hypothetical protein
MFSSFMLLQFVNVRKLLLADSTGQRGLFARMRRTMGIEMSDTVKRHGAKFATENGFWFTNALCTTKIWSLIQQMLMGAHMQSQIGRLDQNDG